MSTIFQSGLMAGKNAFIAGGTSGINLAIAETLSAQGANVAVLGRKPDKAEAAAEAVTAAGGKGMAVTADVRDFDALEAAMKEAHKAFGDFDFLLAGAAGNFPQAALGMSANGFKAVVDIDLLGTFNTFRAGNQFLRKPGASLLAISATQSEIPTALQVHVCAAKAGIDMVVKTLAIEWGGMGVRVNAIAPGPVDDTEGMSRLTPTPDMKKKLEKTIPMGRYSTKEEIANLALFLALPVSANITGAVIVCDGGQSLIGSGAFMNAVMGS